LGLGLGLGAVLQPVDTEQSAKAAEVGALHAPALVEGALVGLEYHVPLLRERPAPRPPPRGLALYTIERLRTMAIAAAEATSYNTLPSP
jgi:hypothetical protein